jgi:hypothetical protein
MEGQKGEKMVKKPEEWHVNFRLLKRELIPSLRTLLEDPMYRSKNEVINKLVEVGLQKLSSYKPSNWEEDLKTDINNIKLNINITKKILMYYEDCFKGLRTSLNILTAITSTLYNVKSMEMTNEKTDPISFNQLSYAGLNGALKEFEKILLDGEEKLIRANLKFSLETKS